MTINKETASLGMPWEKEYGYSQAVKVGDTIYVSGQVSHDDNGNVVSPGDMEAQMRQAYANIRKVLAHDITLLADDGYHSFYYEGAYVSLSEKICKGS